MDASGAADESAYPRTVKSCGPDAPTLASSFAEGSARRWWQESPVTRESSKQPLKPSRAGMPGDPGATVVTNACVLLPLHTRLRVQRAPGIPRSPLGVAPTPSLGRIIQPQLGRIAPRECGRVCGIRGTSLRGAKRRSNPLLLLYCRMDCFAEPVIGRAFARPVRSQ